VLRFDTDFFNATNHPNFDFPLRFLVAPGFGKILSSKQPRLIQFGLKYIF
jgi:hypothetical protein